LIWPGAEFANHQSNGNYYGADYNFNETRAHHSNGQHRYRVSRSAIEADVFINLPKLKTHKKTGVTLSLKISSAFTATETFAASHHRHAARRRRRISVEQHEFKLAEPSHSTVQARDGARGRARRNGFARAQERRLSRVRFDRRNCAQRQLARQRYDLADGARFEQASFYGNADGTFRDSDSRYTSSHRRYLTIVDGIIAGEGSGPMSPDPKPCGMLVGGFNPLAVDTVCATLMGFDYRKLPILARGWQIRDLPLADFTAEEIECVANVAEWNGAFDALERASHLDFKPHFGWTNHVERRALEQPVNA
jgi:uncharacterized protein (DUF362 family)